MDDQDKALNQEGEIDTTQSTTPVEEETTEVQEEEASPETTEESTKKETKKGYSQRVRELNQRAKEAETKAQSLEEKLAEMTASLKPGDNIPNFDPLTPLVKPGEELTAEELNSRQVEREKELMKRQSQISYLQSQQVTTLDRINREAKESVKKYSELDPNSENFDRELSETLTEAAEAYVRANPQKSLETFVDKQMKFYKRAASREAKVESEEIAKQADQSAVRPSAAKSEDKKFEYKTIEEMEATLGFTEL